MNGNQIMHSRKAKEAIKTGLAFVLVYAIALESGWLNPYWAAFAVAMGAMHTAGQSLHKGMDRIAGTVPGCIAGLIIVAVAPQSRWEFLFLTCIWIFITSYMQLGSKNNAYFWTVSGFVCLIIASTNGSSSQDIFQHAVFRVVETVMGIAVYTCVSVFLWPVTNAGAIKKGSRDLVTTQAALWHAGWAAMLGRGPTTDTKETLIELHQREIAQLAQLENTLVAEGSESYEVRELRHLWDQFHDLATALTESLERWHTGMVEIARIDVKAVLPDTEDFFHELDCRFGEIQQLLEGNPAKYKPRPISLNVSKAAADGLSHFELAALAVTKSELETLDTLTAALLACARDLSGQAASESTPEFRPLSRTVSPGLTLPVPDLDHLRAAAYVVTATCAGFFMYIFVDPPGHSGWFNLLGTLALVTAGALQVRVTNFVMPLAVAAVLSSCAYFLIMPRLSNYYELGLLLFVCMFINRYFFSGLAQAMGNIAIINMIPIQNQQTYNFAVQANTMLFLILVFLFLFVLSHIMNSPRPEKKVLADIRRFFRGVEFLTSRLTIETGRSSSIIERWKIALYRHEIKSLPGKIEAWGKAIDQKKYSENGPAQVQSLVTALRGLVYRVENLLETSSARQAEALTQEMRQDIRTSSASIVSAFMKWSENPEAGPVADLEKRLAGGLDRLEERIDQTLGRADMETLSEEDGENFYRLLGAYRGICEAAVAYAGSAGGIDWDCWREEKF